MLDHCDCFYDEQLIQAAQIYQIHPELLPFIGKDYSSAPLKILFVAESHYVNGCTKEDFEKSDWYNQKNITNPIYTEDSGAFHTRGVVEEYLNNKSDKAFNVFRFPAKILNQKCFFDDGITDEQAFCYAAFMNYYQRPSLKSGKTISDSDTDNSWAAATLDAVIRIIKPDAVIFVSEKAHWSYSNHKKLNYDSIYYVSHPCCAWWNRDNGKYGRTKLEQIIDSILTISNT